MGFFSKGGSNIFSRGGGGGSNFFQGGGIQLLIPYRIPYNLCFGPLAPLWISAYNILL